MDFDPFWNEFPAMYLSTISMNCQLTDLIRVVSWPELRVEENLHFFQEGMSIECFRNSSCKLVVI